jgi:hypothetical protein
MKSKTLKQKGGGCGCGSGNPVIQGQSGGGCSACSKIEGGGGGFTIDPTSYFPSSQETYYPLNSYNNDTMMQTDSIRMTGVPISNNLNVTGGNDIKLGGGKKRKSKSKKSKSKKSKLKKKKNKRTRSKKQKGGINLGYVGQNSLLGHGQYGYWFGAPTNNTPDWNASIFTSPVSQNTTGYTEYNPYLV